jgi:hypothetical protein
MGDSMSTIINATTTNGVVIQPDNSGSLVLQTNSGTTALTIDTSQNVGIGTTSPLCKLAVGAGSLSDGNIPIQINSATSSATYLGLNKGGTYGGLIGYSNGGTGSTGLHIRNVAADPILFYVNNTTEAMRIDSSGNLLVGATSTLGSAKATFAASTAITVMSVKAGGNGNAGIEFYNTSSASQGYIVINASSVQYVSVSDYRLKENVAPMTGALDKIAQLKPVTYTWKQDGSNGQGFIAHELQAIVPDCVSGEKDAVEIYTDEDGIEQTRPKYQGVDTSFLVATLTAAIQEQQTIINDLKARVETLEAK